MCFSLNYDITKFHHISLAELNLFQNKPDKRAGYFRFKTVLLNTDYKYSCTIYAKRIPRGKQLNKQKILWLVKRFEKTGSV